MRNIDADLPHFLQSAESNQGTTTAGKEDESGDDCKHRRRKIPKDANPERSGNLQVEAGLGRTNTRNSPPDSTTRPR
jgi:hypothetical protein